MSIIEHWGVSTAKNFFLTYTIKIDILAKNPKVGRISVKKDTIRSIPITKHNRLYYRIDKKTIFLITIFDTHQDPAKNKFE